VPPSCFMPFFILQSLTLVLKSSSRPRPSSSRCSLNDALMPYVRFHHLLSEVTFFSINPSNYITLTSLDTNNPPENSLSQRKVTRGHWSISITNRYDAIEIYVNYIVQKQMGCNISTHVSHVSA